MKKLTRGDVADIRARWCAGKRAARLLPDEPVRAADVEDGAVTRAMLAAEYGVSYLAIWLVTRGLSHHPVVWRRVGDAERGEIARLRAAGQSPREIAATVGRPLATIYRQLRTMSGDAASTTASFRRQSPAVFSYDPAVLRRWADHRVLQ